MHILLWMTSLDTYGFCFKSKEWSLLWVFKVLQQGSKWKRFYNYLYKKWSWERLENIDFEDYCNEHGINHNFSAPITLQEMAITMLNENNLPKYFWAEAVNTSCYVLNRILLRPILKKSPYELWKKKKPNISYFKVFGCKFFILNTKDNFGKFDAKSDVGIFLGYSTSSKAFRVFNKRTMVV